MFVGRIQNGDIYGLWTVRQWAGQEELSDGAPEIVAFRLAQEIELEIAAKRVAALQALAEQNLAAPNASQAVKDYQTALAETMSSISPNSLTAPGT